MKGMKKEGDFSLKKAWSSMAATKENVAANLH